MTNKQITLVQHSWKLLRSLDPQVVGDVFYSRLFFTHPGLRGLFPDKMESQHIKLIQTLNYVISRLDRIDEIDADLVAMARRHTDYGVRPEHYPPVVEALLWTLERGLGRDWSPDIQEAWTICLLLLTTRMQEAAKDAFAA
ncbi:MAG: hemoglobin [Saprospiraceae bacterium]|nr:hemoglobin [Saprospiraceae bacterium]